jgi:hypothetical protein
MRYRYRQIRILLNDDVLNAQVLHKHQIMYEGLHEWRLRLWKDGNVTCSEVISHNSNG